MKSLSFMVTVVITANSCGCSDAKGDPCKDCEEQAVRSAFGTDRALSALALPLGELAVESTERQRVADCSIGGTGSLVRQFLAGSPVFDGRLGEELRIVFGRLAVEFRR
jgi:hypothetical protein